MCRAARLPLHAYLDTNVVEHRPNGRSLHQALEHQRGLARDGCEVESVVQPARSTSVSGRGEPWSLNGGGDVQGFSTRSAKRRCIRSSVDVYWPCQGQNGNSGRAASVTSKEIGVI